jgi:hypothetical protein
MPHGLAWQQSVGVCPLACTQNVETLETLTSLPSHSRVTPDSLLVVAHDVSERLEHLGVRELLDLLHGDRRLVLVQKLVGKRGVVAEGLVLSFDRKNL